MSIQPRISRLDNQILVIGKFAVTVQSKETAMKVLLINPEFPDTYWSFRHALPFEGKRCAFPPLGLLTVSALLPKSWEKRLVDLNVRALEDFGHRVGRHGLCHRACWCRRIRCAKSSIVAKRVASESSLAVRTSRRRSKICRTPITSFSAKRRRRCRSLSWTWNAVKRSALTKRSSGHRFRRRHSPTFTWPI